MQLYTIRYYQRNELLSKLPKIKRVGAQTSNVSFMNALMTQWY